MRVGRRLQRLMLAVHLAVSIGWIGALAAYIALDVTTVISDDPGRLRAAYGGMETIVETVIVPMAVAALVSGIAISLVTRWGLFRHYWVVVSLLLTAFATVVLLGEAGTVGALAGIAADQSTLPGDLAALDSTLVHSIGGLVVLVVVLALNVYKPRGMTRYGWREQQGSIPGGARRTPPDGSRPDSGAQERTP